MFCCGATVAGLRVHHKPSKQSNLACRRDIARRVGQPIAVRVPSLRGKVKAFWSRLWHASALRLDQGTACGSPTQLRVCPHVGIRRVQPQTSATGDWDKGQFAGHAASRAQNPNNEPVTLFWPTLRQRACHPICVFLDCARVAGEISGLEMQWDWSNRG